MTRLIKAQVTTLFALLTALVLTLAACGGGSSSSGVGGGSGGTITGTVNSGTASVLPTDGDRPVFARIMDLVVEPAHAAPVAGVTVILSNGSGPVGEPQVTGPSGTFRFTGLAPGDYTLLVAGTEIPVTLGGAGITRTVDVNSGGGTLTVQINTNSTSVSGSVCGPDDTSSGDGQSDAASDDRSDDCSDDASSDADSADDDSVDDDSADDESVDGDSADDASDDDSGTV